MTNTLTAARAGELVEAHASDLAYSDMSIDATPWGNVTNHDADL